MPASSSNGQGPKLIEYNVRFGDPECQALMVRLKSDHSPGVARLARRPVEEFRSPLVPLSALTRGDGRQRLSRRLHQGQRIKGLERAARIEGVEIFHAGTVAKDGAILANGGRVLNVCASGETVGEAQRRAYAAVDRIQWPDGFCRRDIAWQALEQERN